VSHRPQAALAAAALLAALAVAGAGCAKHTGVLAPTIKDPVVFDDMFGASVDFQAFMGSKLDALAIDPTEAFSGTASICVTVPPPGDPSGTYAGGAFVTSRARDLRGYNALSFRAKASRAITFDVLGLGNDNTGTSRFEAKRGSLAMTTAWTRYVVPIPLAEKLADERGLFFFAEGPEMGQGASVWFDDIQFENDLTITNPRPVIPTQTVNPDVGSLVPLSGLRVTFDVDGVDVSVDAMPGYFTFLSSDESVALGGEGSVRAVGLGTAQVTARLGTVPAAGTITVAPTPSPPSAAPTPTLPAADVLSLFSNAYTNLAVDTWSASWDLADVADVQIAGNAAKKYTNLVYAGIEFTGAHVVDATAMTHFHVDVWAAAGTNFKVKLVDFGANGAFGGGDDREHELTFTSATTPAFTTGGWSALEIPLSSFTNLTTRAHLAQLILSGDPGTAYVDNVYFHR
jgi:hypothetical protein